MNLVKNQIQKQTLECDKFEELQHYSWLQEVIEGLNDDILILSTQGKLLYINQCTRRIYYHLNREIENCNSVPSLIRNICQILSENNSLFSDKMATFC